MTDTVDKHNVLSEYDDPDETRWQINDFEGNATLIITLDKTTKIATSELCEYSDDEEDWVTIRKYNAIETKFNLKGYELII